MIWSELEGDSRVQCKNVKDVGNGVKETDLGHCVILLLMSFFQRYTESLTFIHLKCLLLQASGDDIQFDPVGNKPGVYSDIGDIGFVTVFEKFQWPTMLPLSLRDLYRDKFLWNSVIVHSHYVPNPISGSCL